jgi:low affinity Fe/Cu permease
MVIDIDLRERRSAARNAYSAYANAVTRFAGSPTATVLAFGLVAFWFGYGALHHFPDRWMGVLGVVTGSITFVKVFLIQHAARRNARAVQLKLDAILAAIDARRDLVNVESRPLCEQEQIEEELLTDLRDNLAAEAARPEPEWRAARFDTGAFRAPRRAPEVRSSGPAAASAAAAADAATVTGAAAG